MNKENLSRTVSYILRHNPEDFGLQLAADGSVELEPLIKSLHRKFPRLRREDIIELVEEDPKGRFSLLAGETRIKANYGHSIEEIDPDYEAVKPPQFLFHGSRPEVEDEILQQGLKPMNRNYVHLTETLEEARTVAERRTDNPVIFKIKAQKARDEGVNFYRAGTAESGRAEVEIYLTDRVDPEYLTTLTI